MGRQHGGREVSTELGVYQDRGGLEAPEENACSF